MTFPRLSLPWQLGVLAWFLAGCASVEPFEGLPDGAAPLTLGSGGVSSTGSSGMPAAGVSGAGGESDGAGGNSAGGAPDTASGGAPAGGTAGAPAGGAAGNGTCYVSGCPGCILSMNSLFGTPCCTPAGKCGCQAVFTTTCM